MKVHTDFTHGNHTLVFANGKEVELSKEESLEFEKWFEDKKKEQA